MKIRIVYDDEKADTIECFNYVTDEGMLILFDDDENPMKIINASAWLTMDILKDTH